ncbi:MAG: HupE/UreJ family protein [Hoeflea sp.]|nr:HupE/UreJ family protein [Hoeflea sp.]
MLSSIGRFPVTLRTTRSFLLGLTILIAAIGSASPAFAHTGEGMAGGFLSGLTHPIFGWDHVVAMVAVGLWGAVLGSPAIWILPITFPLVMALGAALGVAGIPVPFIEAGIALSGVVLGLLVALMVRAPIAIAAVLVAIFAIFHGYAHGAELPEAANPFAYAIGFVIATGALHLIGILFGTLTGHAWGKWAIRAGGAVIALVGAAFLAGVA